MSTDRQHLQHPHGALASTDDVARRGSTEDLQRAARAERSAALYRQGNSISKIARYLGVSSATVHKDLTRLCVDRRPLGEAISAAQAEAFAPQRDRRAKARGVRELEAEDAANGVITVGAAEARYGLPRWCIRGWIRENRLDVVHDALGDEIRRLRAAGLSMQAVADELNVKVRVVQLRLEGARRRDRIRSADIERLIEKPNRCQGCGELIPPGRSWHPWCAGNRDPAKREAFAERSGARMRRLHSLDSAALISEGLVPMRVTAELTYRSLPSVRGHFRINRRASARGGVLLGVNAREVTSASPDPHARLKLSKPLAALNGTERVGRPPALSDAEVATVVQLRTAEPGRWGWRRLAAHLNAGRPTDRPVSHMAVKRAVERCS